MTERITLWILGHIEELRGREDGQALVEYSLILALVSVVAIIILQALGANVVGTLTSVANAM